MKFIWKNKSLDEKTLFKNLIKSSHYKELIKNYNSFPRKFFKAHF